MSTINTINTNTPSSQGVQYDANGNQIMTQQDFLKIMVAQFTEQDPLSSGSGGDSSGSSDYVSQLMSMTNLTTMQTMSSEMGSSIAQNSLQLASSLSGKTVEVTGDGGTVTGLVSRARVDTTTNTVYLTINGTEYSADSLISVDQTAAAAAGTTTADTSTNN